MPTIRISYSRDLSEVGQVREVSPEDASAMIGEGRAVLVEDAGSLAEKSKDELLARAAEVGASVSDRDSKDKIATAIRDAEAGAD